VCRTITAVARSTRAEAMMTVTTNLAPVEAEVGGPHRWASLADAAVYLAVSERTLRRMIDRRELPAYRVGKRLMRVDLIEIDAKLVRLRGYTDK
jgi:excisionase family DNA binding protein